MKISVNLNRIPDLYNIKDDFEVARQYFLKHGINIEWTFKNVNVKGYNSVSVNLPNGSQRYIVNQTQTLVPIGNEDITMFVFNQMEWATPHGSQFPLLPNTPTGNCIPFNGKPFVNISAYIADNNNGQLAIQICHELMHALAQINKVQDVMDTYLINDLRDVPGSNFMNQWALLESYLKIKTMYSYFKNNEIVGLKPEFVTLLDKARGIAGVPFIITSGFRTPEQNKLVGGVEDSSHEIGLAVDLRIKDSISGAKILLALVKVGFTRFGFYKDGHLHVDFDNSRPNPCYWIK